MAKNQPTTNTTLARKKLEELSTTADSGGSSVKLTERDWFLLHWVRMALEHLGEEHGQAAVLKPIVREPLEALYTEHGPLIAQLQQIEEMKAAITPQQPKPARGKKKKRSE